MMNEAVKKLWVQTLRDKVYPRARYALSDGYGYCCLGVLCNLFKEQVDPEYTWSCNKFAGAEAYLPYTVMTWAGLNHDNPYVRVNHRPQSLACLNDNEEVSWDQIADLIEEQL